jgi:hypothetical protein
MALALIVSATIPASSGHAGERGHFGGGHKKSVTLRAH